MELRLFLTQSVQLKGMEIDLTAARVQGALPAAREQLSGRTKLLCFGDRLLLAGLALGQVFQEGLIGACSTEQEALAYASQGPDLLIVTEDLEQGYGLSLVRQMRQRLPECICLLFLRRETQEVVREALDAGAQGVMFVSSLGSGDGDFMKAMSLTLEGGTYFPGPIREAAGFCPSDYPAESDGLDQLSSREREVLQALSEGHCNREIAQRLFISQEMVKTHVSTVISKLGVRDRTQAAVTALRLGLLTAA